jgi:hypothetical protein
LEFAGAKASADGSLYSLSFKSGDKRYDDRMILVADDLHDEYLAAPEAERPWPVGIDSLNGAPAYAAFPSKSYYKYDDHTNAAWSGRKF